MRWCSVELAAAIALVAMAAPASSVHAQACHRGVVEDGAIVWRSTIARSSALVGALPGDVALESIEGGVARLEGGRVAGVDASGGAPVVIVTRQSIEEDGEVTLRPPLVSEPQRIVLTARQGSRVSFAPALEGPIERHVGFHASAGIDEGTRSWLDDWCGPRERDVATYVRGVGWGDVRGALVRDAERRGSLLWIGWLVLGLGAIGGVTAYRRLAARAEVERADAVIEGRFRELAEKEEP